MPFHTYTSSSGVEDTQYFRGFPINCFIKVKYWTLIFTVLSSNMCCRSLKISTLKIHYFYLIAGTIPYTYMFLPLKLQMIREINILKCISNEIMFTRRENWSWRKITSRSVRKKLFKVLKFNKSCEKMKRWILFTLYTEPV